MCLIDYESEKIHYILLLLAEHSLSIAMNSKLNYLYEKIIFMSVLAADKPIMMR